MREPADHYFANSKSLLLHVYVIPSSLMISSSSSSSSSMAQPHQTNPRHSCFLGCFGFSTKKKSQQKNTRSLSWPPRFRLSSRKSSAKTVPVNNTDTAEADRSKTKKKPDGSQTSSKSHKPSRQNSSTTTNHVARETRQETSQKGPSLPGSPIIKHKPKRTPSRLSHAVSLPVLEGSQRVGNPRIHSPAGSKDLRQENKELVEKFEPMMGISVIMVTLIIMVLWGRVCAILCTSAWFYICARFRTRINGNESTANSNSNSNDLYLNSKEYKKKVVLEGLLHRNQPFTL